MKLTEFWKSSKKPTISFELFPPRTEKAAVNLEQAIRSLAALKPDFVSVTFGAGGSTRSGSHDLVHKLIQDYKLEVIAYFACFGLGPDDIASVLEDYRQLGVENILAVRGDTPHDKAFQPHPDSLAHASDLIAMIRPRYDFCIGAAGYPENHIDSSSPADDLRFLKLKVDLGAEYIITNYFYDNKFFFDFVHRCRETGIQVPILPGVMPVYSVKMMEMLANLCGATITPELRQGLADLPEGDADALSEFGINYAARQCAGLLAAGVPGLHIYTMDRSKSTVGIIERLRSDRLI